jgi:hypothetical protein
MFIREDLSHAQQIVQTAHAVDELNKSHPHETGNYMVLCGAKSESDLLDIASYLTTHGIHFEMFFESDIQAHTAIATKPLRGHERMIMRKFKTKK